MGYAVVCHPSGSYDGGAVFVTQKKKKKVAAREEDEEAARRRKRTPVAHCRDSQRPQRRTCESAVMGIMQNYGRAKAARETRGGIPEGAIESLEVRLDKGGEKGRVSPARIKDFGQPRPVECFPPVSIISAKIDYTNLTVR